MNVGQLRNRLTNVGSGELRGVANDGSRLYVLWGNLRRMAQMIGGPTINGVGELYVDDQACSSKASVVLVCDEYGSGSKSVDDLFGMMTLPDDDARILVEHTSGSGDYGPLFAEVEGLLVDDVGNLYLHPRNSDERSNTRDQNALDWRLCLGAGTTLRILE